MTVTRFVMATQYHVDVMRELRLGDTWLAVPKP